MKKQAYQKPAMQVVKIQNQLHLLVGSVTDVDGGDTGMRYGGGTKGSGRARSFGGWDDEEE